MRMLEVESGSSAYALNHQASLSPLAASLDSVDKVTGLGNLVVNSQLRIEPFSRSVGSGP